MSMIFIVLLLSTCLPVLAMEKDNNQFYSRDKEIVAFHQPYNSFDRRYKQFRRKIQHDPLMEKIDEYMQGCTMVCTDEEVMRKFCSLPEVMLIHPSYYLNEHMCHREMIYECLATAGATDAVLKRSAVLRVGVSLGGGYSFAGTAGGQDNHVFADVPLAIAIAAKKYSLNRILVIDENKEKSLEARSDYMTHGNGFIFYNNNMFCESKEVTISEELNEEVLSEDLSEKSVAEEQYDIAYYVVRLENLKDKLNDTQDCVSVCNKRIYKLLKHRVPTVVVFSGNVEAYASIVVNYMCNIFDYAQDSCRWLSD